jgi:ribosomal protein L9
VRRWDYVVHPSGKALEREREREKEKERERERRESLLTHRAEDLTEFVALAHTRPRRGRAHGAVTAEDGKLWI